MEKKYLTLKEKICFPLSALLYSAVVFLMRLTTQ
jgi:hypothetical protein